MFVITVSVHIQRLPICILTLENLQSECKILVFVSHVETLSRPTAKNFKMLYLQSNVMCNDIKLGMTFTIADIKNLKRRVV